MPFALWDLVLSIGLTSNILSNFSRAFCFLLSAFVFDIAFSVVYTIRFKCWVVLGFSLAHCCFGVLP